MAKKQKETQEVEAQNQQAPQNPGPILLTRRQRRFMLRQQGALRYISKLPLADKLKIQKEMNAQKQRFIDGAVKNGINKEIAASIFLTLIAFISVDSGTTAPIRTISPSIICK